ncbi:MAG: MFS transporter [Lachnospiraceae bacterium]|jgi:GPH family glycoside/pentoside/hexuronide:cation symporter|nr:MFS transporter [Lachnospiraceae bacterium]MCI1727470.1 MFS transporter [Lachnospiraceae bacterium]
METKELKQASKKIMWIFAVGQLGWSMLSGIVTSWLVYFYQPSEEVVAKGQPLFLPQGAVFIGLTIIGLIAAVGRIFDAVTDPWIAGKSDRCRSRLGRRIPFMRAAAIPLGIVTVLIFFSPVSGTSGINGIFLLIMDLLFYLFMTIYCTPFNALIPELGRTQEARVNVSTYISFTFIIGTATAYLLPNIAGFMQPSLGYTGSIRAAVGILAAIGVVCMLIPAFAIKEADYADTTPSDTPAFRSLAKTFSNKEFQKFVGSDVLYWIALTLFQTGLPFYITVLMKLPDSMSFALFALMTGVSVLFYVPVNFLARKVGKKRLVTAAFIFFACVFLLTSVCGLFGISGIVWGILISFLAAVPMAVLGILPQAIVADIAEADGKTTGENRQGMFYAARTFAFKLGQSAAMLLFTSLALIGTNGFGYRVTAVVAAVLCVLGGIVLFSYNEKKVLSVIGAGK